ncbi:MAG TPA: hypothetical protein VN457_02190, partial [Chlamydiales bacterium]|nr:hypothetical protein [Chlamydiales bacterium]
KEMLEEYCDIANLNNTLSSVTPFLLQQKQLTQADAQKTAAFLKKYPAIILTPSPDAIIKGSIDGKSVSDIRAEQKKSFEEHLQNLDLDTLEALKQEPWVKAIGSNVVLETMIGQKKQLVDLQKIEKEIQREGGLTEPLFLSLQAKLSQLPPEMMNHPIIVQLTQHFCAYCTKKISANISLQFLQDLVKKELPQALFQAIVTSLKNSVNSAREPVPAEPLKTIAIIVRQFDEALPLAARFKRSPQDLFKALIFKMRLIPETSAVSKRYFSRKVTGGLAIAVEKGNYEIVFGTTRLKNKKVRLITTSSKPSEVFMQTTSVGTKTKVAALPTLSKPLSALKVTLIKQEMANALKEKIPLRTLYTNWEASYTGVDSIEDHRKEFFAIAADVLVSNNLLSELSKLTALVKEANFEADFTHFSAEIEKALPEFSKEPKAQKFIVHLFSQVAGVSFQKSILSVATARQHLNRLLFFSNTQKPLDLPFDNPSLALTQLQEKTITALKKLALSHPTNRPVYGLVNDATAMAVLHENNFLQEISKCMVDPHGTFLKELIPDVLAALYPQGPLSYFDERVVNVLREFQSNPRLSLLIESVQVPPVETGGRSLIEATVGVSAKEVDVRAARHTVLFSLLRPWFQTEKILSCHTTSSLMTIQDTALEWKLEELIALLRTGSIERDIGGKATAFRGIFESNPYYQNLQLNPNVMLQAASESPQLQHALSILHASKEQLTIAFKNSDNISFADVFATLQKMTSATPEELEEALKVATSLFDPPLLRVLENATMSLVAPPNTLSDPDSFWALAFHSFSEALHLPPLSSAALNKLRFFAQPSPDGKLSLQMYFNERKVDSDQAFGDVLRAIYIAENPTKKDLFVSLTDRQIAEEFHSHFSSSYKGKSSQDIAWNLLLGVTAPDRIWGTQFKGENQTTAVEEVDFTQPEAALKKLLTWSATIETSLGASPDITIPAFEETHAFRMTPNDPSMKVPPGQSIDEFLQKKKELMKSMS